MSNNFWEDAEDDFRDIPDEVEEGKMAPPMQFQQPKKAAPTPQQEEPLDEEDEEFLEAVLTDDDGEEDYTVILSDARLRLEQGRLYELIMNHDLFNGLNADAKAIKNVQREIKKFAKERMEVMLGMRAELEAAPSSLVLPFNDLEISILKKLASKATNGITETPEADKYASWNSDKAATLNPIGGPKKAAPAPVKKLASKPAAPVERPKAAATKSGKKEDYKPLTKSPSEMSADELIEYNKKVAERQASRRAKPTGALPQPTYEQEEFLVAQRAAAATPAVSAIMALMNSGMRK